MPRYLLLAINGPTKGPGDEETYNRWYDEVHLPDLRGISGVVSARHYKIVGGNLPEDAQRPYVAAYEIETDDLAAVMNHMATQIRPFTPTFDKSTSFHITAIEVDPDAAG